MPTLGFCQQSPGASGKILDLKSGGSGYDTCLKCSVFCGSVLGQGTSEPKAPYAGDSQFIRK